MRFEFAASQKRIDDEDWVAQARVTAELLAAAYARNYGQGLVKDRLLADQQFTVQGVRQGRERLLSCAAR